MKVTWCSKAISLSFQYRKQQNKQSFYCKIISKILSLDNIDGKSLPNEPASSYIVTDPDNGNARVYMAKDEYNVRTQVDNPIRKEQKVKLRAIPVIEK